MTKTRILKSRMKLTFHVRFGSGGGVGDYPADHNLLEYSADEAWHPRRFSGGWQVIHSEMIPSPGTHLRARASGSAVAAYGTPKAQIWASPTGYLATRRILIWDPIRNGRARIGRCNSRPTNPRPIF